MCSFDIFGKFSDEGANKSSMMGSLLNSVATHLVLVLVESQSVAALFVIVSSNETEDLFDATPPMLPAVTWVCDILNFCLVCELMFAFAVDECFTTENLGHTCLSYW